MYQKSLSILGCTLALLLFAASHSAPTVNAAAAPTAPQRAATYVGADTCKDCHAPYFDAWSSTKHRRTFSKLGASDAEGDKCISCHVTGTADMIKEDGAKPRFPGVQCEACHGAGSVHVEQAKAKAIVKGAILKAPEEDNCTKCHNDTSPHYRPFVYVGMKTLVHVIKK
jgi:hypothetical protein